MRPEGEPGVRPEGEPGRGSEGQPRRVLREKQEAV